MDGRVIRGEQTRRNILARAVDIASVEGLEGLSIGRLATDLDVSKSGLFAHFGSKEELQLATIEAAARIFYAEVIGPALVTPPSPDRVYHLLDRWLAYSRTRVFPGGCFFARVGAEFGGRPGRIRDAIAELDCTWLGVVAQAIAQARMESDPDQLAFELNAYARAANAASLVHGDDNAYERADRAVRAALGR
ncbi:TetR/AcrR family transcriptional regulator [Kutzneria buriramensis]|uniref:TetR/AcrR family transcriptional regulator n=1 Tax=Kutzneria buriramensis TaxID=1045776 RepID=UPI0014774310|nr:TetR/AcrR family transcriptional regulator [Kutzneria buriramensis]